MLKFEIADSLHIFKFGKIGFLIFQSQFQFETGYSVMVAMSACLCASIFIYLIQMKTNISCFKWHQQTCHHLYWAGNFLEIRYTFVRKVWYMAILNHVNRTVVDCLLRI